VINQTTLSAIRALLYLAGNAQLRVLPPRAIALPLGESPTYLAKVCRLLARAGILRAVKGVKGGVRLARTPRQITLLALVEACQGAIVGDYCREDCRPELTCAYHHAAAELRQAIVGVLARWSLADLLEQPAPPRWTPGNSTCVLTGGGQR
jgi:Rrf2 family protein